MPQRLQRRGRSASPRTPHPNGLDWLENALHFQVQGNGLMFSPKSVNDTDGLALDCGPWMENCSNSYVTRRFFRFPAPIRRFGQPRCSVTG